MKSRTVLVVLLALVCGGSAAVGVSQLNRGVPAESNSATQQIAVAAEDAPRGAVLSERLVTMQPWPGDMIPPGAITSLKKAIDRSVLVPLVKGEPIMEAKLASKNAGRGLAAMIPKGMRAFTIRTPNVASGVGGFVLPGNRVDVLLTTSSTGSRDRTGGGATTTLLQNIQILAVDQRLDAPDTNKIDPKQLKSVTLLVTPDQAAMLDLGMNKGILHLSLRNPEDNAEADTRPALMSQLRFYQEKPSDTPTSTSVVKNIVASMLVEKTERPVSGQPAASKSRYAEIQTLRGTHRGRIRIEQAR